MLFCLKKQSLKRTQWRGHHVLPDQFFHSQVWTFYRLIYSKRQYLQQRLFAALYRGILIKKKAWNVFGGTSGAVQNLINCLKQTPLEDNTFEDRKRNAESQTDSGTSPLISAWRHASGLHYCRSCEHQPTTRTRARTVLTPKHSTVIKRKSRFYSAKMLLVG